MTGEQLDTVAEVVRSVYLLRGSGEVEIECSDGRESLFFRQGEAFLEADHPAAAGFASHLAAGAGERPREVHEAVSNLVRTLTRDRTAVARLATSQLMPADLVGPLPTALLVMELAVRGAGEEDLIDRLGGPRARYQSCDDTPAMSQLRALDADMAEVLASLSRPATVREIVRGAGSRRLTVLRGLSKLRAVGLVAEATSSAKSAAGAEDLLPPRLLERFDAHVSDSLAGEPLDLDAEEHRKRIAELLGSLGTMNHYELLGVGLKAETDELLTAYNRLARVVHPCHAGRLGLTGKEETMRVLFERATEAYLVLSDPRRRSSYNMIVGIRIEEGVDAARRDEEKRQMARQNYRRGVSLLASMDYSQAVDLLKEAARLDPKAEYFARLAQAQAKNRNWHRHAIESYRRAVELSPKDAGIRAGYGELLEKMERGEEAREQYQAALEVMPDHIGAKEGLGRLRG